jgi:hypothetical protein
MTDAVRFQLIDGSSVLFETDEVPAGLHRVGRAADGIVDAAGRLEEALSHIRNAASSTLHVLQALGPQTLELEFGVKLTAETGALIAKTAGEGHFVVKITWESKESDPSGPDIATR